MDGSAVTTVNEHTIDNIFVMCLRVTTDVSLCRF